MSAQQARVAFTDGEKEQIRAARAAGRSIRDIAAELGRNAGAIGKYCLRHQIPAPRAANKPVEMQEIDRLRAMREQGLSHHEIAARTGRSHRSVQRLCAMHKIYTGWRTNPRYSPKEDLTIRRLRREGVSYTQIGALLQRTRASVLRRAGILRAQSSDWEPREEQILARLHAADAPWEECAEAIDRTADACRAAAQRLGLPARPCDAAAAAAADQQPSMLRAHAIFDAAVRALHQPHRDNRRTAAEGHHGT